MVMRIKCLPKCRVCSKPLVVKEEPAGFTRNMFGWEGEWQPFTGRVATCPDHPNVVPLWEEVAQS